jgi:hypothetical protein
VSASQYRLFHVRFCSYACVPIRQNRGKSVTYVELLQSLMALICHAYRRRTAKKSEHQDRWTTRRSHCQLQFIGPETRMRR